jgi:hypothetical protein
VIAWLLLLAVDILQVERGNEKEKSPNETKNKRNSFDWCFNPIRK